MVSCSYFYLSSLMSLFLPRQWVAETTHSGLIRDAVQVSLCSLNR